LNALHHHDSQTSFASAARVDRSYGAEHAVANQITMNLQAITSTMSHHPTLPPEVFPEWPLGAAGDAPPPRVQWLRDQPLAFIGAWEPLSFRRRTGYAHTDEAEFMREHEFSEAAFKRYAELGANLIVLPFAKGFGLQSTQGEIAEEKVWAQRARDHGLRVAAYIRVDALVPETVVAECPDVEQWLSHGMDGRYSRYTAQQTFRKRLCYSQPGAMEYLQHVMKAAIHDFGADMLHLDGYHISILPWETCRCERCTAGYRRWLKWRFADEALRAQVFGIMDFDTIEMPEFEPGATLPPVIVSADMQAWYQFLWERLLVFTRHLRRFVRQVDPEIAVSINPSWGREANAARLIGTQVEVLLPWADSIWMEDTAHLQFSDGHVVSRQGLFKTAREYSLPVSHYHWHREAAEIEASLALSMASNGGNASCLGFSFRYLPHFSLAEETKRHYTHWAREHWRTLSGTSPVGEIALMRHQRSLAFNCDQPWISAIAMEQLLIRMRVPWRIFDTLDESQLSQIRTLLLPDAESLADEEIELLKDWVQRGGNLFITERTGTHNEYRRRRSQHVFMPRETDARDWFAWMSHDHVEIESVAQETGECGEILHQGKGRLGYWPVLRPPFEGINCWFVPTKERRPPANAEQVEAFLRELHGSFDYEVHGDDSLLTDTAVQPRTGEYLLHIIRTDTKPGVANVTIARRGKWPELRVLSPDLEPPQITMNDDTLQLRNLQRYAVVVMSVHRML
jgi:hypothetical protein